MRQTLLMFDDFFQVVFASDSERSVRAGLCAGLRERERERERVNIGRGFLGATVIFGNVTVGGESRDPTPPQK
jgi:hypothetical protein